MWKRFPLLITIATSMLGVANAQMLRLQTRLSYPFPTLLPHTDMGFTYSPLPSTGPFGISLVIIDTCCIRCGPDSGYRIQRRDQRPFDALELRIVQGRGVISSSTSPARGYVIEGPGIGVTPPVSVTIPPEIGTGITYLDVVAAKPIALLVDELVVRIEGGGCVNSAPMSVSGVPSASVGFTVDSGLFGDRARAHTSDGLCALMFGSVPVVPPLLPMGCGPCLLMVEQVWGVANSSLVVGPGLPVGLRFAVQGAFVHRSGCIELSPARTFTVVP
ncbi:MAG: hypothetical protein KDB80_04080 [Planctomycetes bacterium]|nr:hypothetical protein [Planctomycetota bacterium]